MQAAGGLRAVEHDDQLAPAAADRPERHPSSDVPWTSRAIAKERELLQEITSRVPFMVAQRDPALPAHRLAAGSRHWVAIG